MTGNSGKWKVEGGRWKVEIRDWKLENGEWIIEGGPLGRLFIPVKAVSFNAKAAKHAKGNHKPDQYYGNEWSKGSKVGGIRPCRHQIADNRYFPR